MSGSTTELNLATAVDADDNADYLTINLANSLRTLDALFNNVTGHNHNGAHQGGSVAPAAGSITGGMIADGTVTASDIADAGITNAKLGPDVARASLLTNGGFEVWQRGAGPFTTNGQFTADRWNLSIQGSSTMSATRDASNVDSAAPGGAAMAVTYTHNTVSSVQHPDRENFGQLRGKAVSLSVRVRTATASAVRLALFDGLTILAYSNYHPGGGTWQTLTVSGTLAGNATTLTTIIYFEASCTAYLDNAMLVVGSQPANYVPMHPADDVARCLRYFEAITIPTANFVYLVGMALTATTAHGAYPFKARKAVTPTFTANGPFQVGQASGAQVAATLVGSGLSVDSVQIGTSTASGLVAGNASLFSGNAGSFIAIEANP